MLLCVDVGNTNTGIGLFDDGTLVAQWRVETAHGRTYDEYAVLLRELFNLNGLPWPSVTASIISTVVPSVQFPIEELCRRYLKVNPLVVGPGIKTGMPILYENPREVGADRIVNAVAAFERYHQACIVVDFGTATTFDAVTPKGEYLGGVIAPGIMISADALYHHAAKLPRVDIVRPKNVIGKNTVASMQAGLVFGYAGLCDEIVTRMTRELDSPTRVVATGGLAPLIARESRTMEETDEMLTLYGLRIIYERNR
ncbi:MAG: type III pantothenate kinase [Deltaproteobacteria bacterium]|nr:type III pantothenate kinase [Deltaproteobacteria bacterium]